MEEVVEHLSKGYPEEWDKWTHLKDQVNAHLELVGRTWQEIERYVKNIAEELGLGAWDRTGPEPTDYCHTDLLAEAIWRDPEYYQRQNRHIWDDYEIRRDAQGGWEVGGTWARSQKQENLDDLKRILTIESNRITQVKRVFLKEKSDLENQGEAFRNFLETIKDDYVRCNKRIQSFCTTCKSWIDELAALEA